MALTPAQQSSRLFKKSLGAGETLVSKEFFSEPKLGNNNILPSQIWTQADQIPTTAPVLSDQETDGVVKYFEKLLLEYAQGSTNLAYFHNDLKDSIPFNFGDGTYNYALYKNDGTTQIPFGSPGGDWLIDTSAGLLTWYGTLPSGVVEATPPRISFYKYVGIKGLSADTTSGITSLSTALSNEITGRTSADDSLSTALSNETSVRTTESLTYLKLSGGTMAGAIDMNGNQVIVNVNPVSDYDLANKGYVDAVAQGVSPHAPVKVVSISNISLSGLTTIDGIVLVNNDYVLVAGQTDKRFNGIFVAHSGTGAVSAWTRREDANGDPENEVQLGDFVFVEAGDANGSSGWVLGKTDSPDMPIIPDVETQEWYKMAAPGSYTTDGEGLELNGNIFSLELSGNTLVKSAFGIKLNDTLSTAISNNTFNISTISETLSTEIIDRGSADSSLSTSISELSGSTSGLTSTVSSLSTVISTNSSIITILSGVTTSLASETTSLSISLSNEIVTRANTDSLLSISISGLSTSVSTEISSLASTDIVLSTIISSSLTDITSLSSAVVSLIGVDGSLSTALTGLTSNIISLSTAIVTLISTDNSLSVSITGLTNSASSLSTDLSTEILNRISGDTSLTTRISTEESIRLSSDQLLSTTISTEILSRISGDTSLTSALSTETLTRVSADDSIITIINNLSGVTSQTAGSGLTYNSGDTSLNVNVDNWTIRIIDDTIVGAQQWIQDSSSITVTLGTSGATITLAKDPVTPVSAYVNGIEYLVNPSAFGPTINRPFFYNVYPPIAGTQIWFDSVTAGFDIVGGIDVIVIKYLIVENLIQ